MTDALGETLVLAVPVAISPVPIGAIVLVLLTPRARSNGPAFLAGWILGLAAAAAVVLAIVGGGEADDGDPPAAASAIQVALGAALLVAALFAWRGRPREGADEPSWLAAVDSLSAPRTLGAAVLLSALNPKNLSLVVAAGLAVAHLPGRESAGALAAFVAVGSLGVALPLITFFTLGDRAATPLRHGHEWLARHGKVTLALVLAAIGSYLIAAGLAGL